MCNDVYVYACNDVNVYDLYEIMYKYYKTNNNILECVTHTSYKNINI